ncbi:DNA polymerase [Streptomyces scabiei]|uniref:DNA polymerase n=1 Tax=Streptomyces scabiei TaxID=1930 RepID=UPI0029B0B258|nr:DNA polymerase [Streptomyces scabiei]MDX2575941.1 DNA polymerase [Streptomyces scabiei]MDX2794048.1 DNA polymerase [Streptomyces scabiei]MDX2885586.1 DNA polymerase [Streptomyces scabiei]MDX2993461.1 DNA polymerase [Streptomyces scabiei]MDX3028425.1 DNA polymerase [Streptomyces scabiei]
MKYFPYTIAGDETMTRVPETPADLDEFRRWVERKALAGERVGADTETTGLVIYGPGTRLRTVQFGDTVNAWVLQVEGRPVMQEAARWALLTLPRLDFHNAPFDLLWLDAHLGVPLATLAPKVRDSKITAHLFDPRPRHEGGYGLKLKELAERDVDPSAPDTQEDLTKVFHSIGATKETGWAKIDINHPTYLLYAGLDTILESRVVPVLEERLRKAGVRESLVEFEHAVMLVCAKMERRGMLVDQDYVRPLVGRLEEEAALHADKAKKYGVTSVNAPKQVSEALVGMGETLTERTDSGNLKVDKEILQSLADVDREWKRIGAREPNPLADAVLRSKRAGKWSKSYGVAMRDHVDAAGRIHPKINSLQARTARMSISGPPLQQLPSGDWTIRRALLPDEGHRIFSVDYSAVEMRVLAALADEKVMKRAIAEGRDLHGFTAELIYGPGYTSFHRKLCKGVGFGKVYGGGALTLSRQTGAPLPDVKTAIGAYDRTYRGIKRYSSRLQREARADGYIVWTPVGRRLPLDRDRVYAATNYAVQSTARDVLCQALLDMDDKGLTEYLYLPIHDECLGSAPADIAEDVAREVGDAMAMDFFGVPLDTDPEVGGVSWGSLYMKKAETMIENDPWYAANPDEARAAEERRK